MNINFTAPDPFVSYDEVPSWSAGLPSSDTMLASFGHAWDSFAPASIFETATAGWAAYAAGSSWLEAASGSAALEGAALGGGWGAMLPAVAAFEVGTSPFMKAVSATPALLSSLWSGDNGLTQFTAKPLWDLWSTASGASVPSLPTIFGGAWSPLSPATHQGLDASDGNEVSLWGHIFPGFQADTSLSSGHVTPGMAIGPRFISPYFNREFELSYKRDENVLVLKSSGDEPIEDIEAVKRQILNAIEVNNPGGTLTIKFETKTSNTPFTTREPMLDRGIDSSINKIAQELGFKPSQKSAHTDFNSVRTTTSRYRK